MKILHINSLSDGGAANAAIRLHHGLLEAGIDSTFLTLSSRRNSIKNHLAFPEFSKYGLSLRRRIKNRLGWTSLSSIKTQRESKIISEPIECFSSPETDYELAKYINENLNPDIINLHWVSGFLDYREFFENINKPIVWTLHDENPFGGYWHYSNDNIQNENALRIHKKYENSKYNSIASNKNKIEIVSPSKWLMDASAKSRVLGNHPHHHIPYGLDTNIFKWTGEKPMSIANFNKMDNGILGLFICQSISNRRKGMHILMEALKKIPKDQNVQFIAVGKIDAEMKRSMPSNIFFTGEIKEESELARLYSFVDFTIIPSLQDNLPNTMLESLCCGTPVIGTPAEGIKETILSDNFGWVAQDFTPQALADVILKFIRDGQELDRDAIRSKAHPRFNLKTQANAYLQVYNNILN